MIKFIKKVSKAFTVIALVLILSPDVLAASPQATPHNIYMWAKNSNVARLEEHKQQINVMDKVTKNTALCLAQQQNDDIAYRLLLQFGASTHASCHNNSQLQCRTYVEERGGLNAGSLVLGLGAIIAAVIIP